VAARIKDFFTVGLVGYTNAGKSTLFNTLTDGGAYADDKLFATLSTRTRHWSLGGGDTVMLSDTVGLIRDLPHHLVASFRATLEEAVHADMLLIVLDVAHPRARQQLQTVIEVLDDIGAAHQPRVLLLNKIDVLEHNADVLVFEREFLANRPRNELLAPPSEPGAIPAVHPGARGPKFDAVLPLSALTGRGVNALVEHVRAASRGQEREVTLSVSIRDGKALHFLESRAQILERDYDTDRALLKVRIGARQLDQLYSMGAAVKVVTPEPPE